MIPNPYILVTDNEWNEREFVLSLKEQYILHHSKAKPSDTNYLLDVVKLDFERLADFIRFEALKKKRLITIDRIREILEVKN